MGYWIYLNTFSFSSGFWQTHAAALVKLKFLCIFFSHFCSGFQKEGWADFNSIHITKRYWIGAK